MLLQEGVSPLYVASQTGHLQIVQLLIEYGALVNQANTVSCACQQEGINVRTYSKILIAFHPYTIREFGSIIIIVLC